MPTIVEINDSGEGGSITLEGGFIRIRSQVIYTVLADNEDQRNKDIEDTTGLPTIGTLDVPRGGFVISKTSENVGGLIWEVTVNYDNHLGSGTTGEDAPEDPNSDPDERRPVRDWDFETIDEVLEKDAETNEPIMNSVFQLLPLKGPRAISVLTIQRYERFPFDPLKQHDYMHTINFDSFMGAPKGCAWLSGIKAAEEWINNQLWIKATYTVKFKLKFVDGALVEDTWAAEVLNEATKERKLIDGVEKIVAVLDENDNPIKVDLLTTGYRRDPDVTPDPIYLRFNRMRHQDWAALDLERYV